MIISSREWPRTKSWKHLHDFTCFSALMVHHCPCSTSSLVATPFIQLHCELCWPWTNLILLLLSLALTAVGRSGQDQGPVLQSCQLASEQEQATGGSWLFLSAALPVYASLKFPRNDRKRETRCIQVQNAVKHDEKGEESPDCLTNRTNYQERCWNLHF